MRRWFTSASAGLVPVGPRLTSYRACTNKEWKIRRGGSMPPRRRRSDLAPARLKDKKMKDKKIKDEAFAAHNLRWTAPGSMTVDATILRHAYRGRSGSPPMPATAYSVLRTSYSRTPFILPVQPPTPPAVATSWLGSFSRLLFCGLAPTATCGRRFAAKRDAPMPPAKAGGRQGVGFSRHPLCPRLQPGSDVRRWFTSASTGLVPVGP